MFSNILKKYQKFKKDHLQQEEHLSRLVKQEIEYLTKYYLQQHNHRIVGIHKTQQSIEGKGRSVTGKYKGLKGIGEKWGELYGRLNRGLKEAGDLYNYAEEIEKELGVVLGAKGGGQREVPVVFDLKFEDDEVTLEVEADKSEIENKQEEQQQNQKNLNLSSTENPNTITTKIEEQQQDIEERV